MGEKESTHKEAVMVVLGICFLFMFGAVVLDNAVSSLLFNFGAFGGLAFVILIMAYEGRLNHT